MPQVSFYLLSSQSQQERTLFACKLIEKAYRKQLFCYVLTESQQQSQQLDNQLWTFRAGSFIPHQILENETPDFENTILIGTQTAPVNWQKIIVNLSLKSPDNLSHTERILEILDNNEDTKLAGRYRYRQYQQAGFSTTTHKI